MLNAVIIVVSLFVFAWFASRISGNAILEKATRNASRELALIDKSLSTLVINAEDNIRILTTNDRLQKSLGDYDRDDVSPVTSLDISSTLSAVISSMVVPNTHYAAASIMTARQELFEIGYADNTRAREILSPEQVAAITRKKTPSWISLREMDFRSGHTAPVFTIAKPIVGLDTGKMLGTAALYLEEADIAAIYLENIVNPNDRFLILDNRLQVISSRNKEDLFKPLSQLQPLTDGEMQSLQRTGSVIKRVDGLQVLLTMRTFEKLDWRILSMIPLKEITTETQGITRLIVFLGLACLAFAFAASYFLSHTITQPILSLARLMQEMDKGNLDVRTQVTSKDEVGQLGEGFNRLMEKIRQLLAQVVREQKTKHEMEFRLLQSQIKPHFLYNTMETIISFIKLDMRDNAMLTARNLAAFYRISLSRGHDIISIREEIQLITSYLTIQKLRYVDLDYRLDIRPEILDCQIPKLTLQPLVENAIYHGLKPKRGTGTLTVRGYPDADLIRIEVADDGVGMDAHTVRHLRHRSPSRQGMDSFGISSVHARLQLRFGEAAGIHIESVKQAGTNPRSGSKEPAGVTEQVSTAEQTGANVLTGTTVTVTIPAIKAHELEQGKEADA